MKDASFTSVTIFLKAEAWKHRPHAHGNRRVLPWLLLIVILDNDDLGWVHRSRSTKPNVHAAGTCPVADECRLLTRATGKEGFRVDDEAWAASVFAAC